MTFEELKQRVPGANRNEWHQHSLGWCHNTSCVDESVFLGKGAIVGPSAQVWKGCNLAGNTQILGGVLLNEPVNLFEGVWSQRPVFVHGSQFPMYQARPDGRIITSGCMTRPLEWWDEHVERIAEAYQYTFLQCQEYRVYIEMFKALADLSKECAYGDEITDGSARCADCDMR